MCIHVLHPYQKNPLFFQAAIHRFTFSPESPGVALNESETDDSLLQSIITMLGGSYNSGSALYANPARKNNINLNAGLSSKILLIIESDPADADIEKSRKAGCVSSSAANQSG